MSCRHDPLVVNEGSSTHVVSTLSDKVVLPDADLPRPGAGCGGVASHDKGIDGVDGGLTTVCEKKKMKETKKKKKMKEKKKKKKKKKLG